MALYSEILHRAFIETTSQHGEMDFLPKSTITNTPVLDVVVSAFMASSAGHYGPDETREKSCHEEACSQACRFIWVVFSHHAFLANPLFPVNFTPLPGNQLFQLFRSLKCHFCHFSHFSNRTMKIALLIVTHRRNAAGHGVISVRSACGQA